jgi:hypothetical protein
MSTHKKNRRVSDVVNKKVIELFFPEMHDLTTLLL